MCNSVSRSWYSLSLAHPGYHQDMEIIDNVRTSLNAIGKDGKWVCEWILEKPSRLGLGNISRHYELICHKNLEVRLEILAYLVDPEKAATSSLAILRRHRMACFRPCGTPFALPKKRKKRPTSTKKAAPLRMRLFFFFAFELFSDTKLFDDRTVTFDFCRFQIIKQTTTLTY